MSDPTESPTSSDAFPANWTMPPKPKLAFDSGHVRMFGFQIHPRQVMAISKRLGIDTSRGYSGCVDDVYARLMEELPPEWRHTAYGSWREDGHKNFAKVLYYNTNADEEEINRLPTMESMELVHRLVCATEGLRWYRYYRV
ncbi:hypothetical protein CPC08DRAFT_817316 [Agrocybe pediades]|nr:hypothetical protein CPC08DRAFT_817316 [Agrocybe pediades]